MLVTMKQHNRAWQDEDSHNTHLPQQHPSSRENKSTSEALLNTYNK